MLYQSSHVAQTGTLKLKRLLTRLAGWIAAASAALSDSRYIEGLRDADLDELGLRRRPDGSIVPRNLGDASRTVL